MIVPKHKHNSIKRKYVKGAGFIESLPGIAMHFATDPESAINVGKTAVDMFSKGKKVYDEIKEIKKRKAAEKIHSLKILDLIEHSI